ncbi:MAG: protein-export chaperone SecB [Gammaproteobacteria bacterium]|nr:protein-export chaperone SecB [Gammaproteobacteria bacterium]
MNEQTPDDQSAVAGNTGQTFEISKIYLKDMSFESPLAPRLFAQKSDWRPEFNVQLNAESKPLGDDVYEVVLSLTVSAEHQQQTAWLVEIKQAGLFKIGGFEAKALGHMLGSFCPSTLFPFAREAVADLIGKGGLPSFYLAPINFDALYAQHMETLHSRSPAPETKQ